MLTSNVLAASERHTLCFQTVANLSLNGKSVPIFQASTVDQSFFSRICFCKESVDVGDKAVCSAVPTAIALEILIAAFAIQIKSPPYYFSHIYHFLK